MPFTGYLKGPECSRSLCADSTKRNKLGYEKASKTQWQARGVCACGESKRKESFFCFVFSVQIPCLRPLRKPVDVQKVKGMRKLSRKTTKSVKVLTAKPGTRVPCPETHGDRRGGLNPTLSL